MPRLITWNIGGAKYLELPAAKREKFRADLNRALAKLVHDHKPDFVVLQEVVRFKRADAMSRMTDLVEAPTGYFYDGAVAIDTENQGHPTKWTQ